MVFDSYDITELLRNNQAYVVGSLGKNEDEMWYEVLPERTLLNRLAKFFGESKRIGAIRVYILKFSDERNFMLERVEEKTLKDLLDDFNNQE